jgi:hypothetical protein
MAPGRGRRHATAAAPAEPAQPAGCADTVELREHNAHLLRRRRGIEGILRRAEASRLIIELIEWLIAGGIRGDLTDPRATAMVDGIRLVDPGWLWATGGNRLPDLPIRAVPGRGR